MVEVGLLHLLEPVCVAKPLRHEVIEVEGEMHPVVHEIAESEGCDDHVSRGGF